MLFYCLTEHRIDGYSTRYYLGIATYRADINYCTRRKLMFLQYYSYNVHSKEKAITAKKKKEKKLTLYNRKKNNEGGTKGKKTKQVFRVYC